MHCFLIKHKMLAASGNSNTTNFMPLARSAPMLRSVHRHSLMDIKASVHKHAHSHCLCTQEDVNDIQPLGLSNVKIFG